MATFSPVLRLMPSLTLEKWPVPRVSPISYSSMIAWSMSESLTFSISTPARARGGCEGWSVRRGKLEWDAQRPLRLAANSMNDQLLHGQTAYDALHPNYHTCT